MTIKAKVEVTKDKITPDVEHRVYKLVKLPGKAHKKWVEVTPKRSGNAKAKTRLRGDTINADYGYARQLDRGRSRQAPEGMSKPTERFIKRELDKILRKR